MGKKIVLLNGPVNSGKDFLAEKLIEKLGGCKQQFKEALYIHTAEAWGINVREFKRWATHRVLKESPNHRLSITWDLWVKLCDYLGREYGEEEYVVYLSPRDAMIYTSELVYKPKYGEEYFGEYAADLIAISEEEYHFVSDAGFVRENEVLINRFGVDNVKLVRIHREGCEFSPKDSRSYINLDHLGVSTLDLDNNRNVVKVIVDILDHVEGEGL